MATVPALLKVGALRSPGPAPTYNSSHVVIAVLSIGRTGTIGRHKLAIETGLGEGAVRTVIKWLKEGGYIRTLSNGCKLTEKGEKAYSELNGLMPTTLELSRTSVSVGKEQVAVLVKKRAGLVKSGIEQRDSSIKAGAEGAATYLVRNSKIQVPGSSLDAEKDFPSEAWKKLKAGLDPENGDVIIVCGSDDRRTSVIGAISAALTLLN